MEDATGALVVVGRIFFLRPVGGEDGRVEDVASSKLVEERAVVTEGIVTVGPSANGIL